MDGSITVPYVRRLLCKDSYHEISRLVRIVGWWYNNISSLFQLIPVHHLASIYEDGVASFLHHWVQAVGTILFHL